MKDAILIACHTNVSQVNKLLSFFSPDLFDIYIHPDAKSSIYSELQLTSNSKIVDSPISVQWGGFSNIESTLKLINEAHKLGAPYRYYHLISGQCLPTQIFSTKFNNFFKEAYANQQQFIDINLCSDPHNNSLMERIGYYIPQCFAGKNSRLRKIFAHPYFNICRKLNYCKSNFNTFAPYYMGSTWWSLSEECIDEMIDYIQEYPKFVDFFRHSFLGDEIFFQTLVSKTSFCDKCQKNLRFIDWDHGAKGSPALLTLQRYAEIKNSNAWWARKFNLSSSELDEYFKKLHDSQFD